MSIHGCPFQRNLPIVNAENWRVWISSHHHRTSETDQTEQHPENRDRSFLKGLRARRCPEKSGTKGLQKKAKWRPFHCAISHNFFPKFPSWRVSKRGEIGNPVSRKGLRRRRGSPFFGTCLTSLVLVESRCLLLYRGEPTIIVNNGGGSRMARSYPHTINFNVQRPRAH